MWFQGPALLILCALSCKVAIGQTLASHLSPANILSSFSPAGKLPSSVALSGSVQWTAGSLHDSGTVQLQASANGATTEAWSLSETSHSIMQGPVDFLDFDRRCTFTSKDSKERKVSGPNCLRGVPWFFPSFVLEPSYAGSTIVTDETTEADTTLGLVKLKYILGFPGTTGLDKPALESLARVSETTAVTIFYHATTGLPALLVYQDAFENDESQSIEISVQYTDYSSESGFMIPHRIRRYVQRTLQVDLNVTNVVAQ